MNEKFSKLGFYPSDILLPKKDVDMSKWAVVACDQFTSEPEYWERVEKTVGDAPSTLRLILPEANLKAPNVDEFIADINASMSKYLEEGIFETLKDSLIYIERGQSDGKIRHGLIGMVDLDQYDFTPGSGALIRATEGTVLDRIPPRARVRRNAPIELPHVMLLIDDPEKTVIEPLTAAADKMESVYDFDLMENGGHIKGYKLSAAQIDAVADALTGLTTDEAMKSKYGVSGVAPLLFAVGDGNHSLATAKSCYEELKRNHPGEDLSNHPARYALVELENIHDPAQVFEPIHRVVTGCDPKALRKALESQACAEGGFPVTWYAGEESGTVLLDRSLSELAVGVLQGFLDSYLADHPGEVDYIHDDDALIALAKQPNAIGFLLPAMEKSQLFRGVIADGILPRKTFSMGHSREKRYYLEGRKIK